MPTPVKKPKTIVLPPADPGQHAPVNPDRPLQYRRDLCVWCHRPLKVGALTHADLEKGAMCPSCAKMCGGSYSIAERV